MTAERSSPLQVLIVAGYPALRAGLSALLSQEGDLVPVDDRLALLPPGTPVDASDNEPPDVIVADAGSVSDAAIDDLRDRYPESPIVQIGSSPSVDDAALFESPGAYLPADIDGPALSAAVRAVAQGLTVISPGLLVAAVDADSQVVLAGSDSDPLTPREREVLTLIADGLPNKAIARQLGISEHTAKFHVGSVLGKLGAASRAEAVTLATRRGLLSV
jgi:DNA-binding NarL/FixJ family response regulator